MERRSHTDRRVQVVAIDFRDRRFIRDKRATVGALRIGALTLAITALWLIARMLKDRFGFPHIHPWVTFFNDFATFVIVTIMAYGMRIFLRKRIALIYITILAATIGYFLFPIASAVMIVAALVLLSQTSFSHLGVGEPPEIPLIGIGALIGIVLLALTVSALPPDVLAKSYLLRADVDWLAKAGACVLGIKIGLFQELCIRGGFQHQLYKTVGAGYGFVWANVMWIVLHAVYLEIYTASLPLLVMFATGLILSCLYHAFRRIEVCIGLHMAVTGGLSLLTGF